MFSFFRRSSNITASSHQEQSAKEVIPDADSDNENGESFDTIVEVSGGKGWPTNITVISYHKNQGLICAGTDGGAIYVYGDGFQYTRPWLRDDPTEVVSIVALHPNKILAAFADNSIVIMELPTLEIIDLLEPSWLSSRHGDISSIYCDLPSEKNFVYIGTTEGYLNVLDVMESAIRICDFELSSSSDLGLTGQSMSISDIQSCPKDERYLAIGLEGGSTESGAIVVYDLVKHKVHKMFKTAGISSMHWHHFGEILYAGTRTGEVIAVNVEKTNPFTVWKAKEELVDEDDDSCAISIRRISWLAPQTDEEDEGCLFAMIATNNSDNDNLKNVIVGLHPGITVGEMNLVYSLPPIPNEKITAFRIVPTYDKKVKETEDTNEVEVTPGLLLLVQKPSGLEVGKFEKHLFIARCPTSAIADWPLEIGTLPDPRKATEVQPAANEITCCAGVVPHLKNPISLSYSLLKGLTQEDNVVSTALTQKAPSAPSAEPVEAPVAGPASSNGPRPFSRRLSARQFNDNLINLNDLEMHLKENVDDWEMVLVNGELEESSDGNLRQQDIVFNGHSDGTIVVYGVSMPDRRREFGKASIWLPLTALRCGTSSITVIGHDDAAGLLLSGDEEGYVVLHESFDSSSNIGASDILKRMFDQAVVEAEEAAANTDQIKSIHDFSEDKFLKDCAVYDYYKFDAVREVYRVKLSEQVTAIKVMGSFMTLVVGTAEGSIYYNTDIKNDEFSKIDKVDMTGAHGPVRGIDYGYYLHKSNLVAAIYVFFESGHLLVIDMSNMTILSFVVVFAAARGDSDEEEKIIHTIHHLSVTTPAFTLTHKPTIQSYTYMNARLKVVQKQLAEGAADATQQQSAPAVSPPAPPIQNTRRTFFGGSRSSLLPSTTSPNSSSSSIGTTSNSGAINATGGSSLSEELSKVRIIQYSESQIPKYLVFVAANQTHTLSLTSFLAANVKHSMQSLTGSLTGIKSREIVDKTVLHTQLLHIEDRGGKESDSEEEDDEDGTSKKKTLPYYASVDNVGIMHLISFKNRQEVHAVNILASIADLASDNVNDFGNNNKLYAGLMLPNGSAYLLQQGIIQYSASIIFAIQKEMYNRENNEKLLSSSLPTRAIPIAAKKQVEKSYTLLHGREQLMQALKAQIKKRRSSVINLSAAPTDLYKIFTKTREARAKEELFERRNTHNAEEETELNRAKSNANNTVNELNQLKDALAERGEKINRIAMKMDDFKSNAANYRQAIREQKAELEKRNARWGLF